MITSNYDAEWRKHRKALKTLKVMDREIEMVLEKYVSGPSMMQAAMDCKLYGLYEVPLYLRREVREQVQEDLLGTEVVKQLLGI